MKGEQYADLVWGMVPNYMFSQDYRTPRHKNYEAVAFVMGNMRFPEQVLLFLSQIWSMT